jgi:CheY-like chemotaxis protein
MSDGKKIPILVAEDAAGDLFLIQRAFDKAGQSVRINHVPDGERLMAYLIGDNGYQDRIKYPMPELLLLDLKMPRVNGFEILEWLRGRKGFAELPVVVVTGSNLEEDRQKALVLGATKFLKKDLLFEEPAGFVKSVLSCVLE